MGIHIIRKAELDNVSAHLLKRAILIKVHHRGDWRYTSDRWTAEWVWGDVDRIPTPLRRANIGKFAEWMAGRFRNENGPKWRHTIPLTIPPLPAAWSWALEADRQGVSLRLHSALSKQFCLQGINRAKARWYAAHVHRLLCSKHPSRRGSLSSPTHWGLTQLPAGLHLVYKMWLGGRLPSDSHRHIRQAKHCLHH